MGSFILALDQGTTSSRAILFDHSGRVAAMAQQTFPQHYPQPGWVEHDPLELWESQRSVAAMALEELGPDARIAGIGITNQRETTILWDKATGEPVYNAIVWQCRRTAGICDKLKETPGMAETIAEKTGLVIDAYFSGTKLKWLLDNVPGARERAERGELLFGTVETWLIWRLTGGAAHVTDYSNASRTMLFNIHTLTWDEELCRLLGIPRCLLPRPVSNSEIYGTVVPGIEGLEALAGIPVCGAAGDQQSALFGQGCHERGQAKNTYGTGCFTLMNVGGRAVRSRAGLVTSVAWSLGGKTIYALEGSVFVGGAVIQWLRDELGLIASAAESEKAALSVPDSAGVYIVPAFAGLGAPYWDMYARGTICGLTRGSGKNHIIRACLEAIAYQTNDLITALKADTGLPINHIRADGGAAANNFLMQFQADISDVGVIRPVQTEATAAGAAYLAGLAVGFWKNKNEILRLPDKQTEFKPAINAKHREAMTEGWKRAVRSTKAF